MNQASALESQTLQGSLISSFGDTADSPLVQLGGQMLNNSTTICQNASTQLSFPSVTCGPWCTPFAPSLILDSSISPCTVFFYHGDTRTVHKRSRFGNASTLRTKANHHAVLDVEINRSMSALRQRLQCFTKFSQILYIRSTALCCHLLFVTG
ncbi:hypothetical protein TNCV_2297131 [Trichonephila clavipes]|nr:hypothetical protein TNCV_2297131 [Trichonephila clavipes]